MFQLHVLYNTPEDPAAFDQHYRDVHAKIVVQIPGVTGYTATWCVPGPDGSTPPYYATATLEAESAEALNAAMGSEQGQVATADLANFAGAGVTLVSGESTRYI